MLRPMRTPKEVIKVFKPYIDGKVFCDLGCNVGELLEDIREECSVLNLIGVDFDEENCKILRNKGIEAILGDIFTMDFPLADVYYNFTHTYDIEQIIKRIPKGKVLIIGALLQKFNESTMPDFIKNSKDLIDVPFKPNFNDQEEIFTNPIYKDSIEKAIWRLYIYKKV